jgi:hypothetical protein
LRLNGVDVSGGHMLNGIAIPVGQCSSSLPVSGRVLAKSASDCGAHAAHALDLSSYGRGGTTPTNTSASMAAAAASLSFTAPAAHGAPSMWLRPGATGWSTWPCRRRCASPR